MSASSELERIARLSALFAGHDPAVVVGIGDDAAVLRAPAEPLVWTVDAQVEGTHFRRAWLSMEDVGWRSFMAAASDLAAMGARPLAALSALTLPPGLDEAELDALAAGQRLAAERIGTRIIGGNLARAPVLSVTTTLLGCAARPVTRRGARPGDGVYLTRAVGLAAGGLRLLAGGLAEEPACLAAWRRPLAEIDLSAQIAASASAAIDVSDGLARDAAHLCEASDVRIVFDAAALLALGGEALSRAARTAGVDPLALALGGGEDYAVLLTAAAPHDAFTHVGEVHARADGEPWVALRRQDGGIDREVIDGFDHFAGGDPDGP